MTEPATAAPWRCRYGHIDCIVHPGVDRKPATAASNTVPNCANCGAILPTYGPHVCPPPVPPFHYYRGPATDRAREDFTDA